MSIKSLGSNEYLDGYVKSENEFDRTYAANKGYALDILVNDVSEYVREAVAVQGYGLDILVNDSSPVVRTAVAAQGIDKYLEMLLTDDCGDVRIAVARKGYGLDKLVNDNNRFVRLEVAQQGYGLDKLVNDESPSVRAAVARQGYGLEQLISDDDENVKNTALAEIKKVAEKDWRKNSFADELNKYSDFYDTSKADFLYKHKEITDVMYDNTVRAVYTVPSFETLKEDVIRALTNDAQYADLCDGNFACLEYGMVRLAFYKDSSDVADNYASRYDDFELSKENGNWTYFADVYLGRQANSGMAVDRLVDTIPFISREGNFALEENMCSLARFYYNDKHISEYNNLPSMKDIKSTLYNEYNEYMVYNKEIEQRPLVGAAVLNKHYRDKNDLLEK